MKITNIEIFHADAGWRPWTFIKISTDEDIFGWSECSESNGSPQGMSGVIKDLIPLLIGKDPQKTLSLTEMLQARTKQSSSGLIHKVLAGIENALWDIKGKSLGVPVYSLFGGPIRKEIPLYWSHCGTSRVRTSDLIEKPPIRKLDDLNNFAREIIDSGFRSVKTNICIMEESPYVYMPGFSRSPGGPELILDRILLNHIKTWVSSFRSAVGADINISIDLNFNFKTDGYISICKAIEGYDLSWVEIDSYDPIALKEIKDDISQPIASCENLYGLREYRPFIENRSMDIVIIDVIWNGISKSRSIAEIANSYEMNVATHNHQGYLSTAISSHFCALTPNLRICEMDVDDVPWRNDLFTCPP